MDTSLNPALAEARFCPRCGQPAEVEFPRRVACSHCDYIAYYNPKPVAGAIPLDDQGRVILLRRGFDPGRGLWTFPGGFVDLGEPGTSPEAVEVRAFAAREIPWPELAFWSTELALRDAFPDLT
jgi:NADH pyrophosphatase NudC (nudix superfamily)